MSQQREMNVRNQRFSVLKQPIASVLNQHLINYPTPNKLSYWCGFGSLDGICLVIQRVIGIFLAMHYTPHVDLAFNSVEHIMGDASMFFIVVYLYMFHGLYYTSYSSPREFVRCIGVVIFLLMILTVFIDYVLPWGQMSFWGATDITSLASAIPVVGDTIVIWLWGGFSVDNATLNRFFSLHYVLHMAALHQYGSNNPLSVHAEMDKIAFYPYFYVKDLVRWVDFAIFFSVWIFYTPNYFLSVYAILHSIPDKAAIALVSICMLALPFMKSLYVRSSSFRPIYQGLFWLLLADRCLLGWIGCHPVEPPFVTIGQISPFLFLFFVIFPFLGLVGSGIPHSYTDVPVSEKDPINVRHDTKRWT
ncbi:hypothetical protein MKX01_004649 [Papaver californicum]|nr:hypothetical protein MKX01_004649 [Papaver californicum]